MKKHILILALTFSGCLMHAAASNPQEVPSITEKISEYRALPKISSTQKVWREQNADFLASAVAGINADSKPEDSKLIVELHLRNLNASSASLSWEQGRDLARQYSLPFFIAYFASAEEVAATPVDRHLAASMAIAATRLGDRVDLNTYYEQLIGQCCNHRAYRTWFLEKVRTANSPQQRRTLLTAELKALVLLPTNSDRDAWISQLQKMFTVYKDL